ncbi:MAG: pyridoxamine 5'-phosphate oxidase family protein [Gammaproteobacteria bacterium]|nr:pyridoxamine 5'-phosphate oxidase family protein [Gammaproteobacteria bacterium]
MAAHESITPELAEWIAAQPLFFVASAPLSETGHVNVSPRGLDTFRVLGPREAAFIDLTGSGNETAAHVTENGRLTVMFCAFNGPPRILRLYGHGRVVLPEDAEWAQLRPLFPAGLSGARQILRLTVTNVSTSCGYGVPLFQYLGQRDALELWAQKKGPDGLVEYRQKQNARSLDGLPAPGFTPEES